MKKLMLAVISMSLGLTACGFRDDGAVAGGAVGAGTGFVATGGNPVGAVVGAGVGSLVGQRATRQDIVVYRNRGVVVHDGVSYHIRDGRYVVVR